MRQSLQRLLGAVVLAGALLGAASSTATAAHSLSQPDPPTIGGRVGSWAASEFAGSLAPIRGRAGSSTLAYSLPPATVQGKPLWYEVRLHALVRLPTTDGSYLLSVETNGYTCLQVELQVKDGLTRVDSLDLVAGRQVSSHRGTDTSLDLENYLQDHGVQPGRNTWTVRWETLKGPGARLVTVAADSGVIATASRPDELGLQVPQEPVQLAVGGDARVPFRLVRRGGRPDRPVTVQISRAGPGLTVASPLEQHVARTGTGHDGSFTIHGVAAGRYVMALRVDNAYNSPGALVTVVVSPTGAPTSVPVAVVLGGAGLLGVGAYGWTRTAGRRSAGRAVTLMLGATSR